MTGNTRVEELLVYRKFKDAKVFDNMVWVMENLDYDGSEQYGMDTAGRIL